MPSVPSDISLDLAIGPTISSVEHVNNYTAIQTAINALIAVLNGGSTYDVLAVGGSGPDWSSLPFTAYTPTWTSSGTAPAIGNGTIVGRYARVGKSVIGTVTFVAGSTTTFGTGSYRFSLPISAAGSAGVLIGNCNGFDASATASSLAVARIQASGAMEFIYPAAWPTGTFTTVGETSPWTWADGDSIQVNFAYEAA